jgi:hypothetical protein
LVMTFFNFMVIVHIIGCLWGAASQMNVATSDNWITAAGLQNEEPAIKYLASLYWAIVTSLTVGYGDILPTNTWEKIFAILVLMIGVAIFSYILSSLAN